MDIFVRPATEADIGAIFDIRTSVRENHLSLEQLADLGVTPAAISQAIAAAPCIWIAEVEGQPAAFAMADADDACVFAAFVRPGLERRGLGRMLMAKAEAYLFATHRTIWLVTDGNSRASGFYRTLGWLPVAELDGGDIRFEKCAP